MPPRHALAARSVILVIMACALVCCADEGSDPPPDVTGPTDAAGPTDTEKDASHGADTAADTAGTDAGDADATGSDATAPTDAAELDAGAPDGSGDAGDASDAADTSDSDTEPPPPPCASDAACDDGDACTVDACTKGACTHVPTDCDDGDPCTGDSCDPAAGCASALAPSGPQCCYEGALLTAGFEDGSTSGFFVADLAQNTDEPVMWQPDTWRAHTGSGSLYFGIPATHTYDNGLIVAASATTQQITLPAGLPARLSFWAWLSVEEGKTWDVLRVVVIRGTEQIAVWAKDYDTPLETWFRVDVDLSAFENEQIQVRFVFDSADSTYNVGEGVFIDDVRLLALCAPPPCATDEDCDDGIACTEEACVAGACTFTEAATCCLTDVECNDGDACTVDHCDPVGGCIHSPVGNPLCCNSVDECDDGNPCTTDQCAKNECKHLISQEKGCCGSKQDCDDGDSCTVDSCDAWQCYHQNVCCGSDAECNDADDVCTTDACVAGACVFTPTGIDGCCAMVPGAWSFDEGEEGFSLTNSAGPTQGFQVWADTATWTPPSPPGVLYYGSPALGSYDFGQSNGSALSPPVKLDKLVAQQVSFSVWRETETGDFYDVLRLYVVWSGGATQVWASGSKPEVMSWVTVKVDLSAFAGQEVQLRFDFATGDPYGNGGLGVMLDDVSVTSTCQPKPCDAASDCSDELAVSTEACESGVCSYSLPATTKK